MASKTLQQINKELGSIYDPYAKNIQQRQSMIPEQIKSEEAGLQARQEQAFGDILGGARRRGLGFSGIPLAEQAKYTATEYLPALARLRQSGREQQLSLEEALLGIRRDRATQAQSIYDANRNYDLANRQFKESVRQFNEQMREQAKARAAAAAASAGGGFSPTFGGAGGSNNQFATGASFTARKDGGFNFTDNAGKPISAARYSQLTGQPLAAVLRQMGQAGDKYASNVYNVLAKYQNMGIKNIGPGLKKKYSAIFWGT